MNSIECVPTTWDDVRDGYFFRVVTHLFEARFLEFASGLLGSNDGDLAPVTQS